MLTQSQDFEYLCSVIESDDFAGHFYIAANTTSWLYQWMSNSPEIQAITEKASNNEELSAFIADRVWQLFCESSDTKLKVRSENEAALCVYSFILCSIIKSFHNYKHGEIGRLMIVRINNIVRDIQAQADKRHGWLKRILNRSLRDQTTNKRILERHLPFRNRLTSIQSQTVDKQASGVLRVVSSCGVEFVSEQWTEVAKAA